MRVLFGSFLFSIFFWACSNDSSSSSEDADLYEEYSSSFEESSSSVEVEKKPENEAVVPFLGNSPVVFTEIDPVNVTLKDHEGDDPAWIEIFNQADTAVNLKGTYLTNTLKELAKWKFGDVPLQPKERKIVFLSGKNLQSYEAPHDTIHMAGVGMWSWADDQNEPVAGTSFVKPFDFLKYRYKNEDGSYAFSAQMQYGENAELGWHSASLFVGTKDGSKESVKDISAANELLLTGFLTKGVELEIRLAQPDLDDWKGYALTIVGTGDSSTTYRLSIPANAQFPDLKNIYGTRFAPGNNEMRLVQLTFRNYIARNAGHAPHANFKIKNQGGSLYLTNGTGILDSVAYPVLPPQKTWSADRKRNWGYGDATPEEKSGTLFQELAETLELPNSGFYKDPFNLKFPAVSSNSRIRCEVGGKEPTEASPKAVNPMPITQTTVLRCATFRDGALPGEVINRTYVFETQPTLATVFLTGDPNSWFDPDTGIYMEGPNAQSADPHFGANYWLDKEIPVHVEFFEPGNPAPSFAYNVGYEIFGNYSRANPKKSAAIVFREKYGAKHLEYTVFPQYPELTKFKWLVLRNNGSNFYNGYMRDRLASTASRGLGVDYQKARPAIVFYNGEYYGIHNIRERSNTYYFETNYGLDPERIDLLKAGNEATNGSAADYEALISYLKANGAETAAAYEFVKSKIDVSNFMNYMQTEMYANNRDWPSNNLKKWRSNAPATLWKWFLYDMDFGMGNSYSKFKNNIFEFATAEDGDSWPNGPESTFLLRTLLKNEAFKTAFINRFSVLVATKFSSDSVGALARSMMAEIKAEISRDQKRWKLSSSNMNSELNKTYSFIENRPEVIISEMQEFFELGERAAVTLGVKGNGTISVNGLQMPRGKFEVQFFAGLPVTLTAQPSGSTLFSKWSDGETAATRVIEPSKFSSLVAEFK